MEAMREFYLSEIIKHKLGNRKVAIWGTGPNSLEFAPIVFKYANIDFFIQKDAKKSDIFFNRPVRMPEFLGEINPANYFIIVLAGDIYPEIREELRTNGFYENADYFDWWGCGNQYFSFDGKIENTLIGKYTLYIGYPLIGIASIGRFTSINETLLVRGNHPVNMLGSTNVFRHLKFLTVEDEKTIFRTLLRINRQDEQQF